MSSKYSELIQLAVNRKIIDSVDDVYIPPKNSALLDLINFYQGYMEYKTYTFANPVFLIGAENSLNAWAWKHNGLNIICINHQVFKTLKAIIEQNSELLQSSMVNNNIRISYDNGRSFSDIMIQMVQMFLFYHEVGHLIQEQDPVLRTDFVDEVFKEGEYSIIDHVSEYDADLYSTKRIVAHIDAIFKRQVGLTSPRLSKLFIEDLCVVLISAYVLYRMLIFPLSGSFYTKEHSHPHIIIRINSLTIHLLDAAKKHFKMVLNVRDILQKIMNFLKDIGSITSVTEELYDFRMMGRNNISEIRKYIKELNDLTLRSKGTAFRKTQPQ